MCVDVYSLVENNNCFAIKNRKKKNKAEKFITLDIKHKYCISDEWYKRHFLRHDNWVRNYKV